MPDLLIFFHKPHDQAEDSVEGRISIPASSGNLGTLLVFIHLYNSDALTR